MNEFQQTGVVVDGIPIPLDQAADAVKRCVSAIVAIDSILRRTEDSKFRAELESVRKVLASPTNEN